MNLKSAALLTALATASLFSGCKMIGPSSIRAGRPAYNMAVQQTNDQELLLNLVRIRYRDTLYFTSVERIAATQELNQGIGGSAGLTEAHNTIGTNAPTTGNSALTNIVTKTLSLGPATLSVNEKPTVFYAPLEGEKFVRQMMTPMNPDMLLLLVRSGWSLDRVFALGVQEMNGLRNAPSASGPTPSREPEFREFREAAKLLRSLQRVNQIDVMRVAGTADQIELRFHAKSKDNPEATRLKELLNLNPERDRYKIMSASEAPNRDTIALATRPLISALQYISQGVEAPARDVAAGKIRPTTRENGQIFDWQEMLDGVFKVSASDKAPADASVAINYRGSWFYIADNDLDTKSTFVLITQLIALHSAPTAGPAMSFSFGK